MNRTRLLMLCLVAVGVGAAAAPANVPARPGWTLTWQDEFDVGSDLSTAWEMWNTGDVFNQELQYYTPQQAAIFAAGGGHGRLRITARPTTPTERPQFDHHDYLSARLESYFEQAYGRWEVRAKIPTTQGIWPAIWLLPDVGVTPWPTGGEIDIMEHAGSQTHQVSSAYHWGQDVPSHQYVAQAYGTQPPTAWPDDFHTYAVEWDTNVIQFFVNDVPHFRVTNATAPISGTPMRTVLNTAVGGLFDGPPDATTVFPQEFDIDYVRVWQRAAPNLVNGGFEDDPAVAGDVADPSGWQSFGMPGTRFTTHEVHHPFTSPDGAQVLKMFGPFDVVGGATGLTQAVPASPGETWTGAVRVRNDSGDPVSGGNFAALQILYLDAQGRPVGGVPIVDVNLFEQLLADAATPRDQWFHQTLTTPPAPSGTAFVQLGLLHVQCGPSPTCDGGPVVGGAVFLDDATLWVPAPGSAGVLATAGLGVGMKRRRRRRPSQVGYDVPSISRSPCENDPPCSVRRTSKPTVATGS